MEGSCNPIVVRVKKEQTKKVKGFSKYEELEGTVRVRERTHRYQGIGKLKFLKQIVS